MPHTSHAPRADHHNRRHHHHPRPRPITVVVQEPPHHHHEEPPAPPCSCFGCVHGLLCVADLTLILIFLFVVAGCALGLIEHDPQTAQIGAPHHD